MTKKSTNYANKLGRFARTGGALLALVAAVACGGTDDPTPPTASTADAAPPAPLGVVEVVQYGQGDTTVVFESGLGSDWAPWDAVAKEVSAHARTFAYSRPGYGLSEPTTAPRDAEHIVAELRALLAARGVAPPYVLVGHSFGGAYMEYFAKAHPKDVVGVVLVDPRHRDFTAACAQAGLAGCDIPPALLATLPQLQIDEYQGFASTSQQIGELGTFGAYPVRVLTATEHGFSPQVETLWQTMLGSLAGEAADGKQSLFVGAGHYLQVEKSHDVAQAIIDLLPPSKG